MSHYKIKLLPYPAVLHVFFSPDIAETREQQSKLFGYDDDLEPAVTALCCWENERIGLFFNEREVTHGEIAHEGLHATVWVMDYIGCKLRKREDEHYAYLAGFIGDFIYQCARRAGVKVQCER